MEHIIIDDIESDPEDSSDVVRRNVADALGATDVAINLFELEPGEVFAGGLHAHLDQEEIFYVLDGTATFETKESAAEESTVLKISAGEAVRFPPSEFQQGRNESDEEVVALAIGAPKDSVEGRIPRTCSECGDSPYMDTIMEDERLLVKCPECGSKEESGLH